MEGMKRLTRIEDGKMICGVCNGIADYFNIDPTIVRLVWVLFSLWKGFGILAYVLAAIIMPVKTYRD